MHSGPGMGLDRHAAWGSSAPCPFSAFLAFDKVSALHLLIGPYCLSLLLTRYSQSPNSSELTLANHSKLAGCLVLMFSNPSHSRVWPHWRHWEGTGAPLHFTAHSPSRLPPHALGYEKGTGYVRTALRALTCRAE